MCGHPDDDAQQVRIAIYGPVKVDDVTVHEVDLLLDDLESGARSIVFDEEGDPRLV